MRFAVFTLHNLSQAELRAERKVICTKEDTSLQLHEKISLSRVELATACKGHACATITKEKSQSGVRANAFLTPLKHNARRSRILPASRSVPID